MNMCSYLKSIMREVGLCLIMAFLPSSLLASTDSASDVITQPCHGSVETVSKDSIQGHLDMASGDEDEYLIKTFGDMNGDHEVDVNDVMLVVQYLLSEDSSYIDKHDADVTWDGEVSVKDVMILVNIVLGNSPSLPVCVPLF